MSEPNGGRFRVTRVGAGDGAPVVLLPGMFDNRRLYLWPAGGGLAEVLADSGFDVWIVERRGAGAVSIAPGVRAGWEETVRIDLPAAQELVAAATAARPAFWIGHSFGGVALVRAAAQTLRRPLLAGLVLVNAAVEVPLLANRIVARLLCSTLWSTSRGGVFPARALRLGPEDERREALLDATAWVAAERRFGVFGEVLSGVDVPLLALTAPRDVVAPARRCARLVRSSPDRRVQPVDRRAGFSRNHGHESLLLDPAATADVFGFVRDWLAFRAGSTGGVRNGPSVPGKHRLRQVAELAAPPERVFDVLTKDWASLWPVVQRRVRAGVDPAVPDGLRAVRFQRALGLWPIYEEVVTHQPPRLIEYRTIRGPVRNHLGRLELSPASAGTRLVYLITFDTPFGLPGRLLAAGLAATWRHWSLPRLRRRCALPAHPAAPTETKFRSLS